jgi:hypothetical protein
MRILRNKGISFSAIQMKKLQQNPLLVEGHLKFLIFEGAVLSHSAFGLCPSSK